MDAALVDDLEEFVRAGDLWEPAQLDAMATRLEEAARAGDGASGQLAQFLRAISLRVELGEIPVRMRDDIEAVAYPRLWKLFEAVRDGLPDGELRCRLQVMNRRLARVLTSD